MALGFTSTTSCLRLQPWSAWFRPKFYTFPEAHDAGYSFLGRTQHNFAAPRIRSAPQCIQTTRAPGGSAVAYRFGPFLLNPESRILLRDGEPVPVTAKVLETLLVLVENRSRVMDKDELL